MYNWNRSCGKWYWWGVRSYWWRPIYRRNCWWLWWNNSTSIGGRFISAKKYEIPYQENFPLLYPMHQIWSGIRPHIYIICKISLLFKIVVTKCLDDIYVFSYNCFHKILLHSMESRFITLLKSPTSPCGWSFCQMNLPKKLVDLKSTKKTCQTIGWLQFF